MIESTARALIGVKWVHQGRNPAVGLDCVGLAVLALQASGVDVPDRSDYGIDPDGTLEASLRATLGEPCTSYQPGDIVLIEFSKYNPRHVGIISRHPHGLTLIHADSHAGYVVEHLIDERWHKRIVGAWRLGEVS
jgi:cell wall-associated NlpC family hydrolase